jgi:hypothetical protein
LQLLAHGAVRLAGAAAHALPVLEGAEARGFGKGGPVTRRRIQPKAAVELETVSLRLPAQLVRAVEEYARYLGGSTDRTHVITQAIEIALAQDKAFQKALAARPAAPASGPVRATA